MAADVLELETPQGPARAHVRAVAEPAGALLLGHGAGGGVAARDLAASAKAANAAGVTAVLVEQPYRVAGKRSTPRPPVLDEAWNAVVEQLLAGPLDGLPHVSGGRSSGARVACRTAAHTGAAGVLCLAFPLMPPGKNPASRLPELEEPDVPVLVIQGENDRFGMPPDGPGREVLRIRGDHRLASDLAAVEAAVEAFLERVLPA
jgi:predicted alpha/beta-hydrolase family hydrolase